MILRNNNIICTYRYECYDYGENDDGNGCNGVTLSGGVYSHAHSFLFALFSFISFSFG